MSLKANKDGFRIGEADESNEDKPEELLTNLVSGLNTSNKLLGSIRTDVSAIAKAIGSAHRNVVEPMEVSVRQPIGEEVSDRGIAQIAGGGIGRPRGWS